MDFNKVKTFLTVAETGSISRAAAQLGRTQPAISQQMRQLEEGLGLSLLERRKGRVHLTPEGQSLLTAGRETLGRLEDELTGLRRDLKSLTGTVRLGTVGDHGTTRLAERLAAFQSRYPKVNLQVSYGRSDLIERRLISNELDIGILVTFRNRDPFDVFEFLRGQGGIAVHSLDVLGKRFAGEVQDVAVQMAQLPRGATLSCTKSPTQLALSRRYNRTLRSGYQPEW